MKTFIIAFLVAVIGLLLMQTQEPIKKDFNRNCGCWMAFDSLQNYIDTAFSIPIEEKSKNIKKDNE